MSLKSNWTSEAAQGTFPASHWLFHNHRSDSPISLVFRFWSKRVIFTLSSYRAHPPSLESKNPTFLNDNQRFSHLFIHFVYNSANLNSWLMTPQHIIWLSTGRLCTKSLNSRIDFTDGLAPTKTPWRPHERQYSCLDSILISHQLKGGP